MVVNSAEKINSKSWQEKNDLRIQAWKRWDTLYEMGFQLIPAKPLTKEAMLKWKPLQTERLPREDYEEYQRKYGKSHRCDMLFVCGDTPGTKLVAVDADDADAVALVTARCPDTPMRTQTSRGFHFFYRHPGYRVKQQIGHTIDGVSYALDIKADGTVVVAPGSIHRTGFVYDWWSEWTPEMLESLPVFDPAWLPHEGPATVEEEENDNWQHLDHETWIRSETLPPMAWRLEKATDYVRKTPGTIQGQNASSQALLLAGKLVWGFGLSYELAVDLLLDGWAEREDQKGSGGWYPWKPVEIRHKVQEAIKGGSKYPGVPGDKLEMTEADREIQFRRHAESVHDIVQGIDLADLEGGNDDDDGELDFGSSSSDPTVDAEVRRPAVALSKENRPFFTIEELEALPDIPWQIENHFQARSTVCLFGPSGVGKSFVAFDWAMSVASGKDFLDLYPVNQGSVLYISSEGTYGLKYRSMAWRKFYGFEPPKNIRISLSRYNLQDEEEVKVILDSCQQYLGRNPELIIVDTLSRNFGPGDTDKNADMAAFISNCDYLRAETGSTTGIIHHTGWTDEGRERGAKTLRDSCDTSIGIAARQDKIEIKCVKQKEGKEFSPYVLEKKEVVINEMMSSLVWTLVGDAKDVKKQEYVEAKQSDEALLLQHIPVIDKDNIGQGATVKLLEAVTNWKRTKLTEHLKRMVEDGVVQQGKVSEAPTQPVRYYRDALAAG